MRFCNINAMAGLLKLDELSTIIRASYMLGDETLIFGDTEWYFYTEEMFKNASFKLKTMILEEQLKQEGTENSIALANSIADIKRVHKNYLTVKHKTTQQIVAFRRIEATVNNLFNEHVKAIVETAKTNGMMALKDLVDQHVMRTYYISNSQPEVKPSSDKTHLTMSETILNYLIKSDDKLNIPVVSIHYVANEFRKNRICYEPHEPEATTDASGYLSLLFELPVIGVCTVNELKLLREFFQTIGASFKQAVDNWVTFCHTNSDYQLRIQQFVEQIKPAAEALKPQIDAHNIVQFIKKREEVNQMAVHVLMGETCVQHLLNYYQHMQYFKDETWSKITEAIAQNPDFATQRVPIMCVATKIPDDVMEALIAKQQVAEQPPIELVSVKKSLNID